MRLLVIGNGFDIAHGLRTSYSDFLDICLKGDEPDYQNSLDDKTRTLVEQIKKNTSNLCFEMNKNLWVKYFVKRREEIGENWVDFEREIKSVCEETVKNVIPAFGRYTEFIDHNHFWDIKRMKRELKGLINLLNLYLLEVEKLSLDCYFQQIIDFAPTAVINFNYTSTFLKQYFADMDIDFVHGKTGEEKNSIVLGFNSLGSTKKDVEYAEFIKYFQMVNNDVSINTLYGPNSNDIVESMFFGHSLDDTDGDMIKEIVKKSQKVTLLYHNDSHKAQMIKNLIDIFEEEEFRKLCLSEKRKVFFVEQKKAIPSLGLASIINNYFCVIHNKEQKNNVINFFENRQYKNLDISFENWSILADRYINKFDARINRPQKRIRIAKDLKQHLNQGSLPLRKKDNLLNELERIISTTEAYLRIISEAQALKRQRQNIPNVVNKIVK